MFPYVYVSFVNNHFIENRKHFSLCICLFWKYPLHRKRATCFLMYMSLLWIPTSSKTGNMFPYVYVSFENTHFIESRQKKSLGICLFVNTHFIEIRQHFSLCRPIRPFVKTHLIKNKQHFPIYMYLSLLWILTSSTTVNLFLQQVFYGIFLLSFDY